MIIENISNSYGRSCRPRRWRSHGKVGKRFSRRGKVLAQARGAAKSGGDCSSRLCLARLTRQGMTDTTGGLSAPDEEDGAPRDPADFLVCVTGNQTAGFADSLGLRPRVQRNVLVPRGAMKHFKRVETCDIVDIPLLGPLDFSLRRRLTRGCQIHVS